MFAKVKERIDTGVKSAAGAVAGVASNPAGDRPMPSIIGPDMTVQGNLDTPGEVHVEGRIDGDVACAKLNIGPTGVIRGRVHAIAVRVHGKLQGAIDADEVFLLSGSLVEGDIIQASLEIAPGAQFEGGVRRRKPGERLAPPPVPAAPVAEPPVVVAVERLEETPAEATAPEAEAKPAEERPADKPQRQKDKVAAE